MVLLLRFPLVYLRFIYVYLFIYCVYGWIACQYLPQWGNAGGVGVAAAVRGPDVDGCDGWRWRIVKSFGCTLEGPTA